LEWERLDLSTYQRINYRQKDNIIYDIGGGIGVYSSWLAGLGNEIHKVTGFE